MALQQADWPAGSAYISIPGRSRYKNLDVVTDYGTRARTGMALFRSRQILFLLSCVANQTLGDATKSTPRKVASSRRRGQCFYPPTWLARGRSSCVCLLSTLGIRAPHCHGRDRLVGVSQICTTVSTHSKAWHDKGIALGGGQFDAGRPGGGFFITASKLGFRG